MISSPSRIVSLAISVSLFACASESTGPPVPVASVEVAPATARVVTGQTVQLTATMKDAACNELTGRHITWTSSAPWQATVSATGLVTGVSVAGLVVVTATSEGQSGTATITVLPPIRVGLIRVRRLSYAWLAPSPSRLSNWATPVRLTGGRSRIKVRCCAPVVG